MKSISEYINLVESSLNEDLVPEFTKLKYSPVICHHLDFSISYTDFSDFDLDFFVNKFNKEFGFEFCPNVDKNDLLRGGMPGYTKSYICVKTSSLICFGGVNEYQVNNVFFRFPGNAVQHLYISNLFTSFITFFYSLKSSILDVRCVRIDIAKDCFTGFFDFCKSNDYSTRQRICTTLSTFSFDNAVLDNHFCVKSGWTFYAGRRKNAIMVRVYDKAAERNFSCLEHSWIRVELEIKHSEKRTDWSNECFIRLCNGECISSIYREYLYKYFRILEPNDIEIGDPNRTKKTQVSPEFEEFINDFDDEGVKHKFCEELVHVDFITKQRNCQELLNGIASISLCDMKLGEILAHLILNCRKQREKYYKDFSMYLTSHIDEKNVLETIPFLSVSVGGFLNDSVDVIDLDSSDSFNIDVL